MQPSAGPDLPHTRTRAIHWIATAVALVVVLGASALVQPSDATATPDSGRVLSAATGSAAAPDPDKARYPLRCGPWKTKVVSQAASDFDGDGLPETVAVVRCDSGTGTPPSGMFVLAHSDGGDGPPRIAETLVDAEEQMAVRDFTVRGRTVFAKLLGYSSEAVPRCCPDKERDVEWNWHDGKFVLKAAPQVGSV